MYNCATWQHVSLHHQHIVESTSLSTIYTETRGRVYYQLSESASLLFSSVFSAAVLLDLFHF